MAGVCICSPVVRAAMSLKAVLLAFHRPRRGSRKPPLIRRQGLIKFAGVPVAVLLIVLMPSGLMAQSAGSAGTGGPVFLYFYLDTCGACQTVRPIVNELEREYGGRVRFTRVDIQQDAYTAELYDVLVVPTMVLTCGGQSTERHEYQRFEGLVSREALQRSIDLLLAQGAEGEAATEGTAFEDGTASSPSPPVTSSSPDASEAPPAAAGVGTPASPDALEQVWKRAQKAGSYRFKANLEQMLRPRPVPAMIGQTSQKADMWVEGDVVLPDNARLTVRSEGAGLQVPSVRLIQSGADTFVEVDGKLEPIENPLAGAAPLSDYLGYLAAAVNVRNLEPQEVDGERFTRYYFDIDAGRLNSYLREVLQTTLVSVDLVS